MRCINCSSMIYSKLWWYFSPDGEYAVAICDHCWGAWVATGVDDVRSGDASGLHA